MATEMLKIFFYNLFSYFSNGKTNVSVEIHETLVLQSASIGPDGSSKAEWVETVSNGTMDRFKFTIPGRRSIGNLSFSIKFNGKVDNNKGHHYTVAYETV